MRIKAASTAPPHVRHLEYIRRCPMSWVDIFYLTLVLCALAGFAIALAYYSHQDLRYRTERQRADEAAKPAPKELKPKAPATVKILEHA
jgi:hypothetical protein